MATEKANAKHCIRTTAVWIGEVWPVNVFTCTYMYAHQCQHMQIIYIQILTKIRTVHAGVHKTYIYMFF